MKRLIIAITILLSTSTTQTFAWGRTAHDAIWILAQRMLTDASRQEITKILATISEDERLTIAGWPDTVRRLKPWMHTASCHFADIPRDVTSYEDFLKGRLDRVRKRHLNLQYSGADIFLAILRAEDILRDPDIPLQDPSAQKEDKITALRFLTHLVGDIHQPLHVGYNDDQGGNSRRDISYRGQTLRHESKPANLHSLWDEIMIEIAYEKKFWGSKSKPLVLAKIYAGIVKVPDEVDRLSWSQDLSPETWALETYCGRPYLGALYDGYQNLDSYLPKQIAVVDHRVRQAATRLAAVLNSIFDPSIKQNIQELAFRARVQKVLDTAGHSLKEIIVLKPKAKESLK